MYTNNTETTETTTTTPTQAPGTTNVITDNDQLMRRAGQVKLTGASWADVARQLNAEGYRSRTGMRIRAGTVAAEYSRWTRSRHGTTRTTKTTHGTRTIGTTTGAVPVTVIRTVLTDPTMTDTTKVDLLKRMIA